ncbi:MAG: cytochrome c-type biosis protein CcmF [Solirubrobacteraceae bacterium]|nr:cytochrome c-type biosis protein CcmF [Solirubrobacteraceae bacterium]
MATVGRALLILALAVAAYGIFASLYGARRGRPEWVVSGRRAVYAVAALCSGAFGILELAFLRSDFTFATVASHSSTTTPTFYKAAAAWSSQEGSLMLWLWLLSMWASLVLFLTRRGLRRVAPYATAVLLGFAAFFASLLVFLETPFALKAVVPAEGNGLTPLLRHPSMMIHPPMLYSGYTLFAIPFAFAIGALVTRQVGAADWIRSTRRFALVAWFFLGIGILLGARWSYTELGWGGYWAWDPVENASLLPWLTGTAFLHSIMIQEKRGMLKIWNVSLVLATGILSILGTFLVRSGILDSIHAFGASTLGVPFVLLIGAMVAGSIGLVVWRRDMLRSENRLDSLLSREAIFLANNLVLVAMAFVVFWGTFWPLIAEALTGNRRALGPPWFDRYIVPLALVLVLLSGIGPVIAWRKATAANARRNFRLPVAVALGLGALLVVLGVWARPLALAMFVCGAFVVATVAQEFWRGVGVRRAMTGEPPLAALGSLVGRNRRRYGGYLVHVGMAVLFVGVAASTAFNDARDVRMSPGQSAKVGDHVFTYVRPTSHISATSDGSLEKISFGSVVQVRRGGKLVTTLRPERSYFPSSDGTLGPVGRFFEGEATSEVGLKAGLRGDLWAAMTPDKEALRPQIEEGDRVFAAVAGKLSPDVEDTLLARALHGLAHRYVSDPPPATFRLITSPLVTWIWLGAIIVFLGGLIAMWPGERDAVRRRVKARYAARVARDLGGAPRGAQTVAPTATAGAPRGAETVAAAGTAGAPGGAQTVTTAATAGAPRGAETVTAAATAGAPSGAQTVTTAATGSALRGAPAAAAAARGGRAPGARAPISAARPSARDDAPS